MKQKLILLFALLCSLCFLFSCSSDDEDTTVVTIYVSAETDTYYGAFGAYGEGMQIREEGRDSWSCVPFDRIKGFTYEKGKAYILKVMKTEVSNPSMDDGYKYEYKLISQTVVENPGW